MTSSVTPQPLPPLASLIEGDQPDRFFARVLLTSVSALSPSLASRPQPFLLNASGMRLEPLEAVVGSWAWSPADQVVAQAAAALGGSASSSSSSLLSASQREALYLSALTAGQRVDASANGGPLAALRTVPGSGDGAVLSLPRVASGEPLALTLQAWVSETDAVDQPVGSSVPMHAGDGSDAFLMLPFNYSARSFTHPASLQQQLQRGINVTALLQRRAALASGAGGLQWEQPAGVALRLTSVAWRLTGVPIPAAYSVSAADAAANSAAWLHVIEFELEGQHSLKIPAGTLRPGYVYTVVAADVTAEARWMTDAGALLCSAEAAGGALISSEQRAQLCDVAAGTLSGSSSTFSTSAGHWQIGGGVSFYVAMPPGGGAVLASPSSGGVAMTTSYNISTRGWSSEWAMHASADAINSVLSAAQRQALRTASLMSLLAVRQLQPSSAAPLIASALGLANLSSSVRLQPECSTSVPQLTSSADGGNNSSTSGVMGSVSSGWWYHLYELASLLVSEDYSASSATSAICGAFSSLAEGAPTSLLLPSPPFDVAGGASREPLLFTFKVDNSLSSGALLSGVATAGSDLPARATALAQLQLALSVPATWPGTALGFPSNASGLTSLLPEPAANATSSVIVLAYATDVTGLVGVASAPVTVSPLVAPADRSLDMVAASAYSLAVSLNGLLDAAAGSSNPYPVLLALGQLTSLVDEYVASSSEPEALLSALPTADIAFALRGALQLVEVAPSSASASASVLGASIAADASTVEVATRTLALLLAASNVDGAPNISPAGVAAIKDAVALLLERSLPASTRALLTGGGGRRLQALPRRTSRVSSRRVARALQSVATQATPTTTDAVAAALSAVAIPPFPLPTAHSLLATLSQLLVGGKLGSAVERTDLLSLLAAAVLRAARPGDAAVTIQAGGGATGNSTCGLSGGISLTSARVSISTSDAMPQLPDTAIRIGAPASFEPCQYNGTSDPVLAALTPSSEVGVRRRLQSVVAQGNNSGGSLVPEIELSLSYLQQLLQPNSTSRSLDVHLVQFYDSPVSETAGWAVAPFTSALQPPLAQSDYVTCLSLQSRFLSAGEPEGGAAALAQLRAMASRRGLSIDVSWPDGGAVVITNGTCDVMRDLTPGHGLDSRVTSLRVTDRAGQQLQPLSSPDVISTNASSLLRLHLPLRDTRVMEQLQASSTAGSDSGAFASFLSLPSLASRAFTVNVTCPLAAPPPIGRGWTATQQLAALAYAVVAEAVPGGPPVGSPISLQPHAAYNVTVQVPIALQPDIHVGQAPPSLYYGDWVAQGLGPAYASYVQSPSPRPNPAYFDSRSVAVYTLQLDCGSGSDVSATIPLPPVYVTCGYGTYGQVVQVACPVPNPLTPACGRYDDVTGSWTTDGCTVIATSATHVTCDCQPPAATAASSISSGYYAARFLAVGRSAETVALAPYYDVTAATVPVGWALNIAVIVVLSLAVAAGAAGIFRDFEASRRFASALAQDDEVAFVAKVEAAHGRRFVLDRLWPQQAVLTNPLRHRELVTGILSYKARKEQEEKEAEERRAEAAEEQAASGTAAALQQRRRRRSSSTSSSSSAQSDDTATRIAKRRQAAARAAAAAAASASGNAADPESPPLPASATAPAASAAIPLTATASAVTSDTTIADVARAEEALLDATQRSRYVDHYMGALYLRTVQRWDRYRITPETQAPLFAALPQEEHPALFALFEEEAVTSEAPLAPDALPRSPTIVRTGAGGGGAGHMVNNIMGSAAASTTTAAPNFLPETGVILKIRKVARKLAKATGLTTVRARSRRLRGLLYRLCLRQSLSKSTLLSTVSRGFDPYASRASRAVVAACALLTILFWAAFWHGYLAGGDATRPVALGRIALLLVAGLAAVCALPMIAAVNAVAHVAGKASFAWRYPSLAAEIARRKKAEHALARASDIRLRLTNKEAVNDANVRALARVRAAALQAGGGAATDASSSTSAASAPSLSVNPFGRAQQQAQQQQAAADQLASFNPFLAAAVEDEIARTRRIEEDAAALGWVDAPPGCVHWCGGLLKLCRRHPDQKPGWVVHKRKKVARKAAAAAAAGGDGSSFLWPSWLRLGSSSRRGAGKSDPFGSNRSVGSIGSSSADTIAGATAPVMLAHLQQHQHQHGSAATAAGVSLPMALRHASAATHSSFSASSYPLSGGGVVTGATVDRTALPAGIVPVPPRKPRSRLLRLASRFRLPPASYVVPLLSWAVILCLLGLQCAYLFLWGGYLPSSVTVTTLGAWALGSCFVFFAAEPLAVGASLWWHTVGLPVAAPYLAWIPRIGVKLTGHFGSEVASSGYALSGRLSFLTVARAVAAAEYDSPDSTVAAHIPHKLLGSLMGGVYYIAPRPTTPGAGAAAADATGGGTGSGGGALAHMGNTGMRVVAGASHHYITPEADPGRFYPALVARYMLARLGHASADDVSAIMSNAVTMAQLAHAAAAAAAKARAVLQRQRSALPDSRTAAKTLMKGFRSAALHDISVDVRLPGMDLEALDAEELKNKTRGLELSFSAAIDGEEDRDDGESSSQSASFDSDDSSSEGEGRPRVAVTNMLRRTAAAAAASRHGSRKNDKKAQRRRRAGSGSSDSSHSTPDDAASTSVGDSNGQQGLHGQLDDVATPPPAARRRAGSRRVEVLDVEDDDDALMSMTLQGGRLLPPLSGMRAHHHHNHRRNSGSVDGRGRRGGHSEGEGHGNGIHDDDEEEEQRVAQQLKPTFTRRADAKTDRRARARELAAARRRKSPSPGHKQHHGHHSRSPHGHHHSPQQAGHDGIDTGESQEQLQAADSGEGHMPVPQDGYTVDITTTAGVPSDSVSPVKRKKHSSSKHRASSSPSHPAADASAEAAAELAATGDAGDDEPSPGSRRAGGRSGGGSGSKAHKERNTYEGGQLLAEDVGTARSSATVQPSAIKALPSLPLNARPAGGQQQAAQPPLTSRGGSGGPDVIPATARDGMLTARSGGTYRAAGGVAVPPPTYSFDLSEPLFDVAAPPSARDGGDGSAGNSNGYAVDARSHMSMLLQQQQQPMPLRGGAHPHHKLPSSLSTMGSRGPSPFGGSSGGVGISPTGVTSRDVSGSFGSSGGGDGDGNFEFINDGASVRSGGSQMTQRTLGGGLVSRPPGPPGGGQQKKVAVSLTGYRSPAATATMLSRGAPPRAHSHAAPASVTSAPPTAGLPPRALPKISANALNAAAAGGSGIAGAGAPPRHTVKLR